VSLLRHYTPSAGRFDEMVDDHRAPRPHWRPLLAHLAGLASETMRKRSLFVNDAIASDGVSYNVYADPAGTSRQWELDVMPLVLPRDEWRVVAQAVAQRARLLDAILRDLYGPQTLLAEGLIPPALVFGQRTFLWPAHGIAPPDGVALHVYAADIARSPDGRFWVLADRTRGPAGAGYALQNRMTLARAFPDAFRDVQIEQLAPFFSALRDTLTKRAIERTRGKNGARGRLDAEPPLAVLLTPGPYNETYFEHSFLAKHLGFPLVEGQDLVVRGDKVYLKTLRGLQRVHAILRRLDDDFCDPVELRADSALGVPGLLHVVRAGNVVVANTLGSAVLETGAFSGFYPAVSRRLFGEELLMPSIATWWCGERPALGYTIDHLDELVIKPAYPTIRMAPVLGRTLDAAARADLVMRMQKTPHAYVAQECVSLSQAPTWESGRGGLVPRATTLRVFAVATPDGYVVMPGALARVAPQDGDVASMQWGGSSKDTWVLGEGVHEPRAPAKRARVSVADIAKSVVDIPSRVGENLFWMGRYAERCEGSARLLRAALVRLADASPDEQAALRSLTKVAERLEITLAPRVEGKPEQASSFLGAAVDPAFSGGLAANVLRLHGCASLVRERLSIDNWHILSKLPKRIPGPRASLGAALGAIDEVMTTCVSLAGFAMDDMTRDESWQFLLLGRRLERLALLSSVVANILRLPSEERPDALEWLLEAANSIVTFRARYRREPELLPVLHLVVFDETNPHAVAFQLRELQGAVAKIADEVGGDPVGRSVAALGLELRRSPLDGFEPETGEVVDRAAEGLAKLLERTEKAAYDVSDEVQRRFFSHAGSPVPTGIEA